MWSREVLKPQDWMLQWSYRSGIWQTSRQQGICQISERLEKSKSEFRGFETARDLVARRPSFKWTEALGWGLLSQFSPFRYFPYFPLLSKQKLAIEYHAHIWQVSPQLSCGDTCQRWMWFRESNRYFCKIENFAYGEISERSFSNPHPWCSKNY